jgi:hypothetical protein
LKKKKIIFVFKKIKSVHVRLNMKRNLLIYVLKNQKQSYNKRNIIPYIMNLKYVRSIVSSKQSRIILCLVIY